MRIHEILTEATELKSSVAAANSDIGNTVTGVYDALEKMARNWANTQNSMNGFQMLSASIGARWYDQLGRKMLSNLRDLAKQAGGKGKTLYEFMGTIPNKWNVCEKYLPEILLQLGKDLRDERMVARAQAWIKQREAYKALLKELADSFKEPKREPEREKKTKDPQVGQQSQQIEKIVNDVLAKLPKEVQHSVRTSIARADNKLMALKQELDKRNIKI